MTTAEKIETILNKARKPQPAIVQRTEHKADNGRWYSVLGGFPYGVRMTDETRSYYVFSDGRVTYGKRFETEELARRAWELNQDEATQEFHAALLDMTDEQINRQFDYWNAR